MEMNMNNYTLITGASSGIGKELAHFFARDKNNLVLTARNECALEDLASSLREKYSIEVIVIITDLSKPGAAQDLYSKIQKLNINITNLVNNAGFGVYGKFIDTPLEVESDMITVNILVLTQLTKLFSQDMKKHNRGRIMNVASTAAFQPGPLMSVYYSTKAFVLSFSESLANELSDTNITVTALCPGPTDTGFMDRANLHDSKLFSGKLKTTSVQLVAEKGYKGMMSGKTVVVPGLSNRILVTISQLAPRKLVTKIVRNIQEKR